MSRRGGPHFAPIPAWPMLAILLWGTWPPPLAAAWPSPWNQPRHPSACWNGTMRPAVAPVFYLVAWANDPSSTRRTPVQIPVHVYYTGDTVVICGS